MALSGVPNAREPGSAGDLILTVVNGSEPWLDGGPNIRKGVPFFSSRLERMARVSDDNQLVPLRQSGQLLLEAREIAERIVVSLDEQRGLHDLRPLGWVTDLGAEPRMERVSEGDHGRHVRIGRREGADAGAHRGSGDQDRHGPALFPPESHAAEEIVHFVGKIPRDLGL
jgi:hypothetical protein